MQKTRTLLVWSQFLTAIFLVGCGHDRGQNVANQKTPPVPKLDAFYISPRNQSREKDLTEIANAMLRAAGYTDLQPPLRYVEHQGTIGIVEGWTKSNDAIQVAQVSAMFDERTQRSWLPLTISIGARANIPGAPRESLELPPMREKE